MILPFEPDQPVAGSPFRWSMSRHDTFDRCKRKYFLQYYGAANCEELQRLKKLSSVPMWAGTCVHDFCEAYLKTKNVIVSEAEQEEMIRQVTHGQMPQDWRYSEARSKPFRLWEHEYAAPVGDLQKRAIVGLVITCLRNWFRSDLLAEAYAVGRAQWLTIEDMVTWEIEGVPVTGAMDFAYRRPDGTVRIVDWKTGRSAGKHNRGQVEGYATYAVQQGWARTLSEVETTLAYLVIPEFKDARAEGSEGAGFIVKSAADMRSAMVDQALNTAKLEDFDQCGVDWQCRTCQFRRVCFPRFEKR